MGILAAYQTKKRKQSMIVDLGVSALKIVFPCQPFVEKSLRRFRLETEGTKVGHGAACDCNMTAIVQDRVQDRPAGHRLGPDACVATAPAAQPDVKLTVHEDLSVVADDWRRFEQQTDCTVFQTFDWLTAWQHHIGARNGVQPAIVVGRDAAGDILFLLPLATEPGLVRRLTWLGNDLCDYNAPLLGPAFPQRVTRERFLALWSEIRALLQRQPRLRHDIVALAKMPETVGAQPNPFLALDLGLNPSGAHLTHLAGTWDEFYAARRSSATRRRDRTKRKRLGEIGEVRFVNPVTTAEIACTLDALIAQKTRSFARMGVADLFARPGYREFFLDLATGPATRDLVHVSRLEVGPIVAAANLGLQFRGCYYHILASYDDGEVSRFGPGAAHLRDLMERAVDRGFTRFDFTIGDERYKLEWSDTVVKLYDHMAAATARGRPVVFFSRIVRRLKRTIKQSPALWQAFQRTRAALAWLQGRRSGPPDSPAAQRVENAPSVTPD
jgi:CelD/BcsL family acetyltransferase involved in cellulose biosynthesis